MANAEIRPPLFARQDAYLEEVAEEISEISREIEGLKLENEVLRNYRERQALADGEEAEGEARKVRRRRQVLRKLTTGQKCEIATVEQERLALVVGDHRKTSEKLADTLRAVLEETDIRIAEMKKDAYEFKRDIVVGAENMRTGKTMAEKLTRYMEEKLRQRDSVIEKLRLKNSTIKTQLQKAEMQMKQKEEMGDVLHYIDFHQLQIENKQYQALIEARNEELLQLKRTTGKTLQTLNILKKKLMIILNESGWLHNEINARKEQLQKAGDDAESVSMEIANDPRAKEHCGQQQAETSDMPSTLDYVQQKAQMYDLQSTLRNWRRKIEIMEMAAARGRILCRGTIEAL